MKRNQSAGWSRYNPQSDVERNMVGVARGRLTGLLHALAWSPGMSLEHILISAYMQGMHDTIEAVMPFVAMPAKPHIKLKVPLDEPPKDKA